MNNKKIGIIFLLFLLIINSVYAFDLTSQEISKNVCPSTTALFTATVSGAGNFNINYEGSASSFATVVPQGFSLNNKQRPIYTYITPKLNTAPGNYKLNLIVTSGTQKTLNYDINVGNCNQVNINGDQSKDFCACNSQTYEYNILNSGNYDENYKVEVTGSGSKYVKLSEEQFTLKSKDSKKLLAYFDAPCGTAGNYDFNLNIKSLTTNSVASFNSKANVLSCYDFNLVPEKTFIDMCEHTVEKIPIKIDNLASADNEFSLLVTGPAWSNLENDFIKLKANEKQNVNLILNPDYGVQGNFDINIKTNSKEGKLVKEQVIKANIKKCNDVLVNINKSEDNICNIATKQYNVKVKNTGEFDKDFTLSTNYPWASLDRQNLTISPGKEENVNLIVNPNKDLKGIYEINVKATALDSSKVSSEDTIKLNLVEVNSCYTPEINAQDVKLSPDTTATIEVRITNNGPENANYLLSLSGKASSFVQINPSNLEVNSGKTEVTYLYVAPPFNANLGDYDIMLNARVQGSNVLGSKDLKIILSQENVNSVEKTVKVSFWDRILSWLKRNLVVNQSIKETINENKEFNETNVTTNENYKEEVVSEIAITKKNIITQDTNFNFKNEKHSIKIKEISNTSVTLEILSTPRYMILDLNETEKLDIDQDGTYDLALTLKEVKNGKPVIETQNINEKITENQNIPEQKNITTTNENNYEKYKSSFLSFITLYKFYIILGIIILIVLILIFSYWKEIIDFFEEEPEQNNGRKRRR